MWKRHWGLSHDPFLEGNSSFVPLPSHQEALARLVHTIESGQRMVRFRAASGLGKTCVLRRALSETRTARRRFAILTSPIDGASLFAGLATRLGGHLARARAEAASRTAAWTALERTVRVCGLQGLQVVLAVDDSHELTADGGLDDLKRLSHLGVNDHVLVTTILVTSEEAAADASSRFDLVPAVDLKPLTRSEAARYLTAKLGAAGGSEAIFTPRAVTRLHALAGGVPRGLDRLASLCLMAGALRGLEAVPSELVDRVASEFHPTLTTSLA